MGGLIGVFKPVSWYYLYVWWSWPRMNNRFSQCLVPETGAKWDAPWKIHSLVKEIWKRLYSLCLCNPENLQHVYILKSYEKSCSKDTWLTWTKQFPNELFPGIPPNISTDTLWEILAYRELGLWANFLTVSINSLSWFSSSYWKCIARNQERHAYWAGQKGNIDNSNFEKTGRYINELTSPWID